MTKHSKSERERRAAESARMVEIQRAWEGSIPSAAAEFALEVASARVLADPFRRSPIWPRHAPETPSPRPRAEASQDETTSRRRY